GPAHLEKQERRSPLCSNGNEPSTESSFRNDPGWMFFLPAKASLFSLVDVAVGGAQRTQPFGHLGQGEGAAVQHVDVLADERREPRHVFVAHVDPLGTDSARSLSRAVFV